MDQFGDLSQPSLGRKDILITFKVIRSVRRPRHKRVCARVDIGQHSIRANSLVHRRRVRRRAWILRGQCDCLGHEQHQHGSHVFPLALGVVLGHFIQGWMSRPKQLPDVLGQELELFAHNPQRVY